MKIDMKVDLAGAQSLIDQAGKQARFAAARALTSTAQEIREAIKQEMVRVLDRPTPYTLNSQYVKPATKDDLRAEVWLKDDRATSNAGIAATRYLLPQIDGGTRRWKRFERALQITQQMPNGWFAVPAAGARLDAYGNVSSGQIIQILSQLRVTLTAGYTRNMSTDARKKIAAQRRAGGRFFVVLPGDKTRLKPGVYQRELMGRTITPVLAYVRTTAYRKRLDYYGVAGRIVADKPSKYFYAYYAQAMATAR